MEKEYLDFIERMGSFEMELSLEDVGQDDDIAHSDVDETLSITTDDILQHYGVLGMKWGVRRSDKQLSKARKKQSDTKRQNGDKEPGKIKQTVASIKREREWNAKLKEVGNMSTKDVNKLARRVTLENDLKKLSKSDFATAKNKQDYLRRAKMSDQELNRKVTRLRAINSLNTQVNRANARQVEVGKKVASIAGSIALAYVTGTVTNPSNISKKTNQSSNKAVDDMIDIAVGAINKAVASKRK